MPASPESLRAHWPRIGELFEAAVDEDPSRRRDFVLAQADNEAIAGEVLRLLRLHDQAGDFLESPILTLLPPDEPGDALPEGAVVADRFDITRLLGRGGMGVVYEAYDRVLREPVALKLMRSDVANPDTMLERFRREVQLARRISHPGVCRVHDVAFHTSTSGARFLVLTMELLRGETLAQRLSRGPLSMHESLDIAAQLGSALDAAHSKRILHLDIKPENIFLEPERDAGGTRAVLTDFGLAHAFESNVEARGGVPAFGTPKYMAPELLEGGEPSVRSDVYAFGLVLDETAGSVDDAQHRAWRDVTAVATRANPRERYRTAGELVSHLARAVGPSPRGLLSRPMALGAAAAILVALFFGGLRLYSRAGAQVGQAAALVIVPTANATGDVGLDGVTEVLRSQLIQSTALTVVPPERVYDALQRMRRDTPQPMTSEVAREIAMRAGAALVLTSTISTVGPGYRVEAVLERVGARPSLARATWRQTLEARSRDGVFDVIHDTATWVRTVAGEAASELAEQDRPPTETTTGSWEALRLYVKANETQAAGGTAAAVLLLDEALRLDPEFAAAHMRRADLLLALGRDREGYAAWREAIRLTEKRQMTSREHLQIRAQYLEDINNWAEAEQAYRTYVLHYPNDADAAFRLGSTLAALGRPSEALTWFDRAIQLKPGWLVPLVHSTTTLLDAGSFAESSARIATLRRNGDRDYAVWLEGLTAFARGDVAGAIDVIAPIAQSSSTEWRSRGFSLRAAWRTEIGQHESAEMELQQGMAFDAAQGLLGAQADKLLALADVYRRTGRTDACADAVQRALVVASSTNRFVIAGTILARAGRSVLARQIAQRLEPQADIPRITAAWHRLYGEVALAEGRIAEAVTSFKLSSSIEPQYRSRFYLATALAKSGDRAGAAAILEQEMAHRVLLYRSPDTSLPGQWRDVVAEHEMILEAEHHIQKGEPHVSVR